MHLDKNALLDWHQQAFGRPADLIASAPGRVNLIGEHTDYNQGFVLPAAINYYTHVSASARGDRRLELVARGMGGQRVSLDLDGTMQRDPLAPWSDYARGLVQQLRAAGYQLAGGELLIAGDVPTGAGLSSSASLEMALISAFMQLSGESISGSQAALIGQAAENRFVGCNCGIMDQLISACGRAKSALLIDCRDLACRPVAIPESWEILIVHSGVKRGLVDSEYNLRRQQCERAAVFFGKASLRDLSLDQLLGAEGLLDALSFNRARHVLSENARTLATAEALQRGNLSLVSRAMAESHASMRDDFAITTPAIDALVSLIAAAGGDKVGVRMTGGGFGGCVVAIAPREQLPGLVEAVERDYTRLTGCLPKFFRATASAGAFV